MDTLTKDEVAENLARSHYEVDSGVTRIYRLVSSPEREADPNEPIKLLEIYEHSIPYGEIAPVHFPPHPPSGLMYPTEIVQIAPEEFTKIQSNELKLPEGWEIGLEYPRSTGEDQSG